MYHNPFQDIDHLLGDDLHGDFPAQSMFQEQVATEREVRYALTDLPNDCRDADTIIRIEQAFITEVEGCDVRIRRASVVGGDTTYTMTAKYRPLFQEQEMEISPETFASLWPKAEKKQKKTRYELPSGWIVDDMGNGYYVAEYEMKDGEHPPKPPRSWSVDRASVRGR